MLSGLQFIVKKKGQERKSVQLLLRLLRLLLLKEIKTGAETVLEGRRVSLVEAPFKTFLWCGQIN